MRNTLRNLFSFERFLNFLTLGNVVIFLALAAPIALWFVKRRSLPPGPFALPCVGSVQLLKSSGKSLNKTLMDLGKRYGKIFRLSLGNCHLTVIQGHELIQETFSKSGDALVDRPTWLHCARCITGGRGLLWSDRSTWMTMSKLAGKSANQLLTSKSAMEVTIQEEIRLISNELYMEKCRPVDIGTIISNAIYNIVSTLTFGERLEFDRVSCRIFKKHLQAIVSADIVRMPENYQIYRRWLSKQIDHVNEARRKVIEFIEPRLTNHKSAYIRRESMDFIDICLQHNRNGDTKVEDTDIIQSIVDLFVAGCEPTSSVILWGFLFFIRYPEMQKRCRFEILKGVRDGRNPTWADRDKMVYLQAVLLEIKRYASAVSCGLPYAVESDVEIGGYKVPRGDMVIFHQFAAHMDPTYWKRPTEFRPENFIDSDGKLIQHAAYFPYGLGARACPFSSVADKILFLTFATILMKYELRAPEDSPLPSTDSIPGPVRFPKKFYICPFPIEG